MKILMISPQPYFEPRGTPISVYQRLNALSQLGHQVDLVTYHIGESPSIPNVNIHRIVSVPLVKHIRIGPSWIKLLLDILVFIKAVWLLLSRRYDVIHSHEEAAFFALILAPIFRTQHLYDMHSSLPRQLESFGVGNWWPLKNIFVNLEKRVIKSADAIITIDQELAQLVKSINPRAQHINIENTAVSFNNGFCRQNSIPTADEIRYNLQLDGRYAIVYTGTFERYQGLELVIQSVEAVKARYLNIKYILVGGQPKQVEALKQITSQKGLEEWIHFTGIVSPEEALVYLDAADIILSSRVEGTSVPLKVYSYLHAAKPIVATNLDAHTQVFNSNVSILVEPTAQGLADGILEFLDNPTKMNLLAAQAKEYANEFYSATDYIKRVKNIYSLLHPSLHRSKNAMSSLEM